MPLSDLKPFTVKYIQQVWQKEWDEAVTVSNRLHEILPKLSDKLLSFCKTRKVDTFFNGLRIGKSFLMHSFISKKEEPPVCVTCNTISTIKHILIECADSVWVRKKYFVERSLYAQFRNVNQEKHFYFLNETGVFYRIRGVLR